MLVLIYLFRAFLWAKKVLLKNFIYYKLVKGKKQFFVLKSWHTAVWKMSAKLSELRA